MIQLETLSKEVDEIVMRSKELSNQIKKDKSRAIFFQKCYEEIMAKPDPEKWIVEMIEIYTTILVVKRRIEKNLKEFEKNHARLMYLQNIILPAIRYMN